MTAHAKLSASASARWIACPGSIALSAGKKDSSSVYADWGTAAHEIASWCLTGDKDAEAFHGRKIAAGERFFTVDDEMVNCVQTYVEVVRGIFAQYPGATMLVEQRVDYSNVVGVKESFGTADVLIVADKRLIVIDLKTGRGEQVDAFENYQLRMYALGALEEYGEVVDFDDVQLVISQPRISRTPSEHVDTLADLQAFAAKATRAGQIAMLCLAGEDDPLLHLQPGEKQCMWCRAKATCPALNAAVAEVVSGGESVAFEDITAEEVTADTATDQLLKGYRAIALVEGWVKAVTAEAYSRGERGELPGYKIVAGKRGARAWTDPEAAEAALKAMRLKVDEMYDFKVISPTSAEKVLKENPRKWAKILPLIGQGEGKPVLVPESDKRTALPPLNAFDPIENDNDDLI